MISIFSSQWKRWVKVSRMTKIICFHNPEEENGYLSNWYLAQFKADGQSFSSLEQYMMYEKAITFKDNFIAEKIMKSEDAAEMKALGRSVQNYSEIFWNGIRQIIVFNGLLAKFEQNPELKTALVQTSDAILAECAVKDRTWGIGISMNDENRFNIEKWKGMNLLGYTLMEVRKTIK